MTRESEFATSRLRRSSVLPSRPMQPEKSSAWNDSPDLPFDRSINPYRGCEHGCIYCYARPSHAYLGFSPGLDFETRLVFKPDAAALLRAELAKPGYACAPIALGSNTDPYQPVERDLGITRAVLEVLADCGHPVMIVTKSARVERDIDILGAMAKDDRCSVAVSVTTLDRSLARRMEPRASAPHRRLETIRRLTAAGVPTGVMAAPMIPFVNDAELETILEHAREAGALGASYTMLRLPLEIADLFREWLDEHYPDRAERVMERIRDTRGGKDYDSTFGQRMRGTGPVAELLAKRFRLAVKRLGFPGFPALDCGGFVPPARRVTSYRCSEAAGPFRASVRNVGAGSSHHVLDSCEARPRESLPWSGNLSSQSRKELQGHLRTHVVHYRHSRASGNDYSARRCPGGHNRHSRASGNDYSARRCPEGHNRHSRASGNPREPRRHGNFRTTVERISIGRPRGFDSLMRSRRFKGGEGSSTMPPPARRRIPGSP